MSRGLLLLDRLVVPVDRIICAQVLMLVPLGKPLGSKPEETTLLQLAGLNGCAVYIPGDRLSEITMAMERAQLPLRTVD